MDGFTRVLKLSESKEFLLTRKESRRKASNTGVPGTLLLSTLRCFSFLIICFMRRFSSLLRVLPVVACYAFFAGWGGWLADLLAGLGVALLIILRFTAAAAADAALVVGWLCWWAMDMARCGLVC